MNSEKKSDDFIMVGGPGEKIISVNDIIKFEDDDPVASKYGIDIDIVARAKEIRNQNVVKDELNKLRWEMAQANVVKDERRERILQRIRAKQALKQQKILSNFMDID